MVAFPSPKILFIAYVASRFVSLNSVACLSLHLQLPGFPERNLNAFYTLFISIGTSLSQSLSLSHAHTYIPHVLKISHQRTSPEKAILKNKIQAGKIQQVKKAKR